MRRNNKGLPRPRAASPADFVVLTAIWKESVLATHSFLAREDFFGLMWDLSEKYLPMVRELWLMDFQGAPAAFCGSNGNFVEMLFVTPPCMGKGLGSQLLDHVRSLHGPLRVDVNEANAMALDFYLRRGFKITGRSARDGAGRPYPLLHLAETDA